MLQIDFRRGAEPVPVRVAVPALGQRVLAQAQGYEDLNDHDTLRDDPLLALAAGKPARVIGELMGKQIGYCRGRGGSQHISVPELGFLGTNGITASLNPETGDVNWLSKDHFVTAGCTVTAKDGRLYLGGFNRARDGVEDRFVALQSCVAGDRRPVGVALVRLVRLEQRDRILSRDAFARLDLLRDRDQLWGLGSDDQLTFDTGVDHSASQARTARDTL